MGIGLEEQVLRPLLDVASDQFLTDLTEIVPGRDKSLVIGDLIAVDVFHYQHVPGCQFLVHRGNVGKFHGLQNLGQPLQIFRFLYEIQLLLRHAPGLIQRIVDEPQDFLDLRDLQYIQCFLQHPHVLFHHLIAVRALDLDSHAGAVQQIGIMHLCDGGRPYGNGNNLGEDMIPWFSVFLRDDLTDLRRGDGGCIVAQVLQSLAVFLGQDLRVKAQQLPQLDEGGAEILEHVVDLVRSQSLGHFVFIGHRQDLSQPFGISKKAVSGGVVLHNCPSIHFKTVFRRIDPLSRR